MKGLEPSEKAPSPPPPPPHPLPLSRALSVSYLVISQILNNILTSSRTVFS